MDFQTKRQLERIIDSLVSVKYGYSNDVPSRRLEGQFGGEIIKAVFSELNVYIQYSPKLIDSEIIEEIVNLSKYKCKRVNAGTPFKSNYYIFNDVNDSIMHVNKNLFSRQRANGETLLKAVEGFEVGENIRVLDRISRLSIVSENALCVFITDDLGCELSDRVKKKYRRIKNQSIWITIDEENIEVKKGIPLLNKKNEEKNDD